MSLLQPAMTGQFLIYPHLLFSSSRITVFMESYFNSLIIEIKKSPKYRHISEEVIVRVIMDEQKKFNRQKEVMKSVKAKLHQIYGAYMEHYETKYVDYKISQMTPETTLEELQKNCSLIMMKHSSTKERITIIKDLYSKIFEITGVPKSISDFACGLNPFTYPFMPNFSGIIFFSTEIDTEMTTSLNNFYRNSGINGEASTEDLIHAKEFGETDLVFLFKILPVLDRQIKNGGIKLLEKLNAKKIVVSFPGKSLGGKEKGMRENYDKYMRKISEELNFHISEIIYEDESFYILSAIN